MTKDHPNDPDDPSLPRRVHGPAHHEEHLAMVKRVELARRDYNRTKARLEAFRLQLKRDRTNSDDVKKQIHELCEVAIPAALAETRAAKLAAQEAHQASVAAGQEAKRKRAALHELQKELTRLHAPARKACAHDVENAKEVLACDLAKYHRVVEDAIRLGIMPERARGLLPGTEKVPWNPGEL